VIRASSFVIPAKGASIVIRAIYIAADPEGPMVSVPEVLAVPQRGLEGDRYFDGRGSFSRWPGEGRDVTLIEHEAVEAILAEHRIDLRDGRSRRNIVTAGGSLADLNGRTFRIGDAVLWGARECAPCRHLERLVVAGLMEAMSGRGGLRANVREAGRIRVGDTIAVIK
jgi:MOSC domain-containing protein YiiM